MSIAHLFMNSKHGAAKALKIPKKDQLMESPSFIAPVVPKYVCSCTQDLTIADLAGFKTIKPEPAIPVPLTSVLL
jgi:hypothetical protein